MYYLSIIAAISLALAGVCNGYISLQNLTESMQLEYDYNTYAGKLLIRKDNNVLQLVIGKDKVYCNKNIIRLKENAKIEQGVIYLPEDIKELVAKWTPTVEVAAQLENENTGAKENAPELSEPDSTPADPALITTGDGQDLSNPIKSADVTLSLPEPLPSVKNRIDYIILDPGHGGTDPGAIGQKGLREKKVVLEVALQLKELLEHRLPGVKIIISRNRDIDLSLKDRTKIANRYAEKNINAFFISIHANASLNKKATGYETYILSRNATDDEARSVAAMENGVVEYNKVNDKKLIGRILTQLVDAEFIRESTILAQNIQEGYGKNLSGAKLDKGVKKAFFFVLEGVTMPAVLTEIGFITNKDSERDLRDISYLRRVALGIADGVINFVNVYNKNQGFKK